MAEPGEILQNTNQLSISDKLAEGDDPRSQNIIERGARTAFNSCWEKEVVSNEIIFPRDNGKIAKGVETIIPVQFCDVKEVFAKLIKQSCKENGVIIKEEEVQKRVAENMTQCLHLGDIGKLPSNIKRVRVIDMSSEEALPRNKRRINSMVRPIDSLTYKISQNAPEQSIIDKMISTIYRLENGSHRQTERLKALGTVIADVFNFDKNSIENFKKMLESSTAEEILIIHGHGGNENVIGEQEWEFKEPEKESLDPHIDLENLIEKYDDPKRTAAILVATCYHGKENPPVRRIPVYRLKGMGGASDHPFAPFITRNNATLMSEPKTRN